MSVPVSLIVLLLALDGPVGHGIPPVVARFGGDNIEALSATFARHPAESMPHVEIEWFLEGGAIGVPMGRSGFIYARTTADDPILTHGTFPLSFPLSAKTETYRGVVYQADPDDRKKSLATIRLVLFPPDVYLQEWKNVAESDLSLTLVGPLPGLREFFQAKGIRFSEGREDDFGAFDRNGMLVVDAEHKDSVVIPPGTVRAALIFAAPDRSWQSATTTWKHTDAMIWTQRTPHLDFASDPLAQNMFLHLAEPLIQKIP